MRHVLVVDDDPDIRKSIRDLLEDDGYSVADAANGAEAIELLRHDGRRPSVITVDLLMPVMDGDEFIRALRSDARLADIPVVVLSAAATVVPAGMPTLRKPIGVTTLLAEIEHACAAAVARR